MENKKSSDSLSVVLFVDNFYPAVDGVVRTVHNYAKILNETDRVAVVAPRYFHFVDNQPYKVIRSASLYSIFKDVAVAIKSTNLRARYQIRKQRANLYHVHSPFVIGHFALRLARRNHVPIVATFHSKYKDDFMKYFNNRLVTSFLMGYVMRFYNAVDEVWACSPATADTLRSYGFKKNIVVMENGTDFVFPDNIERLKSLARQKFGIDPTKKNLLFVGQLIKQKNLLLVMDTVNELCQSDPDYVLTIAGTSLVEKEIKEYAKNLACHDRIHFVGIVKDSELLKGLYGCADLFFFPSLYDNAPLVVREAAVMKLPSLLSKGSTCAEVIVDGENGFLAEPTVLGMSEKIKELFDDRNLLTEAGTKAAATIPVSWNVVLGRARTEYRRVIDDYHRRHKK